MTKGEMLGEASCVGCRCEVFAASDGVLFERAARWELRLPVVMWSGSSWHVGVPLGENGVKVLRRTMVWPEHVCSIRMGLA